MFSPLKWARSRGWRTAKRVCKLYTYVPSWSRKIPPEIDIRSFGLWAATTWTSRDQWCLGQIQSATYLRTERISIMSAGRSANFHLKSPLSILWAFPQAKFKFWSMRYSRCERQPMASVWSTLPILVTWLLIAGFTQWQPVHSCSTMLPWQWLVRWIKIPLCNPWNWWISLGHVHLEVQKYFQVPRPLLKVVVGIKSGHSPKLHIFPFDIMGSHI